MNWDDMKNIPSSSAFLNTTNLSSTNATFSFFILKCLQHSNITSGFSIVEHPNSGHLPPYNLSSYLYSDNVPSASKKHIYLLTYLT